MICLHCNAEFDSKDKRQKFCGLSCSATYNNINRKNSSPRVISCESCHSIVELKRKKSGGYYKRRFCDTCGRISSLKKQGKITRSIESRTKEDLFNSRLNWQSARTAIRKHAVEVFSLSEKAKCCEVCGYSNHFEICHVKSVASFEGSATLAEINSITNLMALCPNHHWEFDNGVLIMPGAGVEPAIKRL